MLQVVNFQLTVPNQFKDKFIEATLDNYYWQSAHLKRLATETDVVEGLVELIKEMSSYQIYGDPYFYKELRSNDDIMDFEMCDSSYYDGYVHDIVTVLDMKKMSFQIDGDIFRNLPVKNVW